MPDHDPVATGWRIHDAHVAWTANVDSKANFVLAIESAMLAGVVAFDPAQLKTAPARGFFWTGVMALVLALIGVALVVRPRLRRKRGKVEAFDNFIYFGHMRHWSAEDLESKLAATDMLPMLSRNLVAMAKIAWMKHTLVQRSLEAAFAAGALFALSAWAN